MLETAFVVAGTVCVGCFAVLAGGACPGRLAEARDGELLFLSEYMTICQQSAVFATVPWALAYAVGASMVCGGGAGVLADDAHADVSFLFQRSMRGGVPDGRDGAGAAQLFPAGVLSNKNFEIAPFPLARSFFTS
jgi:hypothetical protein